VIAMVETVATEIGLKASEVDWRVSEALEYRDTQSISVDALTGLRVDSPRASLVGGSEISVSSERCIAAV